MAEKAKDTIWKSFLDSSSKRVQNEHGTCVIIGDTKCGKTDLVLKLCADKNLSQQAEEDDEGELVQQREIGLAKKELLSYDYFYIDDDDDTTDDSRVNVWSFNDHMFEHAFDIVGKDAMQEERMLFVVCVDLDKPAVCVDSLKKWLIKAAAYIKKFSMEFPEKSVDLKKKVVNYLKNARETKGIGEHLVDDPVEVPEVVEADDHKPSGETKEGENEENVDEEPETPKVQKTEEELAAEAQQKVAEEEMFKFIEDYFGVPIIVVACKSDLLSLDDANSVRELRELQGRLRSICIDVGAALVYASTYIETNMPQLKKYCEHRLYPENVLLQDQQGELALEDKLNETFIPAGFDTHDLIHYSTGLNDQTLKKNIFRNEFSLADIDRITDTADHLERDPPEQFDLESEQDWLDGLYSFVTQISGGAVLATVDSSKVVESDIMETSPSENEETKTESESKMVAKKTTKGSATGSDNVGDFFKNLLQAPQKK